MSNSCPSWSTRSTAPGAIRPPRISLPRAATARPRISWRWWTTCTATAESDRGPGAPGAPGQIGSDRVECGEEELVALDCQAAGEIAAAGIARAFGGLVRIGPNGFAGDRVQRVNIVGAGDGVHHAVDHQRRGLKAAAGAEILVPGESEPLDVVGGDLGQRAVARIGVIARLPCPLSRRIERRQIRGCPRQILSGRLGIARSFQIPRPFRSMTVLENLLVPLSYVGGITGREANQRAEDILAGMGLAAKMHQGCSQLSQVELRKMELARAMAADPQLLISDEAMAGLAGTEIDEVLAILHALNQRGITIIMIEHIMQAVMSFSQRVVCLDAGQIICEGAPSEVVADPYVQRAYLGD